MTVQINLVVIVMFVLLLLVANIILFVKELVCWKKTKFDTQVIAYDHNEVEIYRNESFIIGAIKPVYLMIGVPTVYREHNGIKVHYLTKTINSMIENLTEKEKNLIQFLILLADREPVKRMYSYQRILQDFSKELKSGLINVIAIPDRYYLPLIELPRTLGDSEFRMYWRSKQVLDYTFMFNYAHKLCKYYMQTEDDVITLKSFFKYIVQDLINDEAKRRDKKSLPRDQIDLNFPPRPLVRVNEYFETGFIGRVFESCYLPFMSSFLRTFYDQIPVDLIYPRGFEISHVSRKKNSNLFQHIGNFSSSAGT